MNSDSNPSVGPLEYQPNMAEVARRWDAHFARGIIDRPLVCVTAPKEGAPAIPWATYRDKVFGDLDAAIDWAIARAEWTYFGGESVPTYWPSFGPDEIAVFCGASFEWDESSGDTNWSVPIVTDWDSVSVAIQEDHPLWLRMLDQYRRATDRVLGKMLISPLDLHTNMDLLAALRGPAPLCMDCLDVPDALDRAMSDARKVFPYLWDNIRQAGRFDEMPWKGWATTLQCDFSCLIGPEMFRRWVQPALIEETEIVGRAIYHWDGPDAIKHMDDLMTIDGLHTFAYVPNPDKTHLDHLDLYKEVQARGKSVSIWGQVDLVKAAHKELRPDRTMYTTYASSQAEADEILEWFVRNT